MRDLALRIVAVGVLLAAMMIAPTTALAKDFPIIATIECGVKSGQRCPDGTLVIGARTDQVTGRQEVVKVDLAWIIKHAPTLRQDDQLCIEVRDDHRTDGVLQALAFVEGCEGPKPKPKREKDDPAPQISDVTVQAECNTTVFSADTPGATVTRIVFEMSENEGFVFSEYDGLGTSDTFEAFYENVSQDGPFNATGNETSSFFFGPGTATRVVVVVTSNSLPPTWSVSLSCPQQPG